MTWHAPHMSCEDAVRLLWDYLDEELDDVRRARVRLHLQACEHCREHFGFHRSFLRAVAAVVDEPIDTTTLRRRIVDALEEDGYGTVDERS